MKPVVTLLTSCIFLLFSNCLFAQQDTGCLGSKSGWTSEDIGNPSIPGMLCYQTSLQRFTMQASGADIYGTSDQFRFTDTSLKGNGVIVAKVTSLTANNPWAKAGVMIREAGNIAGSDMAIVELTKSSGIYMENRLYLYNGTSSNTQSAPIFAPYWVKLVRLGNTFIGYSSPDGQTWTVVDSAYIIMDSTIRIGLAVTSHDNSQLATAVFDNVSIASLPNDWHNIAKATSPSYGPYCGANSVPGQLFNAGEVMYSEIMVDTGGFKTDTYWETLSGGVVNRQGQAGQGGYAGIQSGMNNIFSIWDYSDTTTIHAAVEYALPNTNISIFGGEGTGTHTDNHIDDPMPWQFNTWYATAWRRWTEPKDTTGTTRIGFFMYDYGKNKWTYCVGISLTPSYIVPGNRNSYFSGSGFPGPFLENFADQTNATRYGYYGNFWMMDSTGHWNKPTYANASAGQGSWKVETAPGNPAVGGSNTVLKLSSCGINLRPTIRVDSIPINQPGTKPVSAIPAKISSATVQMIANSQAVVNWIMDSSTSPQLSYTINVYTDSLHSTPPIAILNNTRPEKRIDTLQIPSSAPAGTYYFSIQVKDIFDQLSNVYNFGQTNGIVSGNIYTLVSDVNNSSVLDVQNGYTTNGNPVQLYQSNDGSNQKWTVTSVGSGYYKLQPLNAPTKCLDVKNARTANGTRVDIYTDNSTNAQKWQITPTSDGYFTLTPACAIGSCLDVNANGTADGTKVQIWTSNGGNNQKWKFVPITQSTTGQTISANSEITTSTNSIFDKIEIYPNPPKNNSLNVRITAAQAANAHISLFATTGTQVYTTMRSLSPGQNVLNLQLPALAEGVYILKVSSGKAVDKQDIVKVIVQ